MAPAVSLPTDLSTTTPPNPKLLQKNQKPVDKSIFPDGFKTTGQQPPLYDQLYPYSAYPKEIKAPTLWRPEDYATHPEQWIHPFSADEIQELSDAADAFIAQGLPLTGISKENFRLPKMAERLESMRTELLNGKGFILYKGFPVNEWVSNQHLYLTTTTHSQSTSDNPIPPLQHLPPFHPPTHLTIPPNRATTNPPPPTSA